MRLKALFVELFAGRRLGGVLVGTAGNTELVFVVAAFEVEKRKAGVALIELVLICRKIPVFEHKRMALLRFRHELRLAESLAYAAVYAVDQVAKENRIVFQQALAQEEGLLVVLHSGGVGVLVYQTHQNINKNIYKRGYLAKVLNHEHHSVDRKVQHLRLIRKQARLVTALVLVEGKNRLILCNHFHKLISQHFDPFAGLNKCLELHF